MYYNDKVALKQFGQQTRLNLIENYYIIKREDFQLNKFPNLKCVSVKNINEGKIMNSLITNGFTNIKKLIISNSNLDIEDFKELHNFVLLEELIIYNCSVNGDDLNINSSSLKYIDLKKITKNIIITTRSLKYLSLTYLDTELINIENISKDADIILEDLTCNNLHINKDIRELYLNNIKLYRISTRKITNLILIKSVLMFNINRFLSSIILEINKLIISDLILSTSIDIDSLRTIIIDKKNMNYYIFIGLINKFKDTYENKIGTNLDLERKMKELNSNIIILPEIEYSDEIVKPKYLP